MFVKNSVLSSDLDMKINIYLAAVKFRKFSGKWIKGRAKDRVKKVKR